jgi:hypothetical protein
MGGGSGFLLASLQLRAARLCHFILAARLAARRRFQQMGMMFKKVLSLALGNLFVDGGEPGSEARMNAGAAFTNDDRDGR